MFARGCGGVNAAGSGVRVQDAAASRDGPPSHACAYRGAGSDTGGVVPARRNSRASAHVEPGNVMAQSAAGQISAWYYICSAMNGSSSPFAIRRLRAIRSRPLPVNTNAANSVARLMKL